MNTNESHERTNPETPARDAKPENKQSNIIFVGNKPLMNYVTGIVMQFTKKNAETVVIKARGKFISKAVDIAEVARRRFLTEHNVHAHAITVGTEEYNKDGKKISVSTIDITLAKKD